MKVSTKSGFKLDFDERIMTDWRVVKAMGKADSDNPSDMLSGTIELVSLIFGDDEERLIDHIKDKNDGYAPVEAIKEELLDVINKVKAGKNSRSSQA